MAKCAGEPLHLFSGPVHTPAVVLVSWCDAVVAMDMVLASCDASCNCVSRLTAVIVALDELLEFGNSHVK